MSNREGEGPGRCGEQDTGVNLISNYSFSVRGHISMAILFLIRCYMIWCHLRNLPHARSQVAKAPRHPQRAGHTQPSLVPREP